MMRGIGTRILIDSGYRTFTVRKERHNGTETEFEKRCKAIESDGIWLYPSLTIQAYVKSKEGPVVSIGLAWTKDIIDCVKKEYCFVKQTGNAGFYAIEWSVMREKEYPIQVIESEEQGKA